MNQLLRIVAPSTAETAVLVRDKSFDTEAAPPVPSPSAPGLPIRLRGVKKSFGDHRVLHGVDLDIPAGQFVAIVGRSGCGKSTLLRLIAGLDRADAGSIQFAGEPTHGGQLRVMFQEPRLLPWQRVRGNVEVGLGRGRASDAADRALQTLRQVELAAKADQWPATLSGGQRQRVALARALISRPRALLFDEPLGALDALTRITMQQLVQQVWAAQGFTAILVTHDVQEAVALADRVIVIEEGRIADDYRVSLPRPRRHGDPVLAVTEGDILARLMGEPLSRADAAE